MAFVRQKLELEESTGLAPLKTSSVLVNFNLHELPDFQTLYNGLMATLQDMASEPQTSGRSHPGRASHKDFKLREVKELQVLFHLAGLM